MRIRLPFMLIVFAAAVVACLASSSRAWAQAGEGCAVLTWDHPAAYTNGDELSLEQIANTMVLWSRDSADAATIAASPENELVPGPAATATICGFDPGPVNFVARTLVASGEISAPSNVAGKVFAQPAPAAPENLSTSDPIVYAVVMSRNRLALVQVGTIAPDVPCDATQDVNGRNVVPRESVEWFGNVRPEVVVAECSADF